MQFIKIMGIFCFVSSSSLIGFFKSRSLKLREQKLLAFCSGLDMLYEYISFGELQLGTAVKMAFSKCDFLKYDSVISTVDSDLDCEDKRIINELFMHLGRSVKKTECERIISCRNILLKRAEMAYKTAQERCKLWQIGGVCVGLAIGILVI